MHFENLWEKCEELHKEAGTTISTSLMELDLKFSLYKKIDVQGLPSEEAEKIKSRVLGEILLTITNISLVDNINVFKALSEALQFRSIEHYTEKYK
jgi:hypothetical protein